MTPVNSPPATSAPHARRLHVLVADDMLGNQKTAMMMLKHLGHTGMLVGDGDQALRCLAQHRFDVVLLDDHMPGMDGRQVLQALRQSERAGKPATTVIMVTANDLPGDREQYLALGANGYLAKPLKLDFLRTELAQLFGSKAPAATRDAGRNPCFSSL